MYTKCDWCGYKTSYKTEEEADDAAFNVEKQTGSKMIYYLCPYGNGYHIAHEYSMPKRERKNEGRI